MEMEMTRRMREKEKRGTGETKRKGNADGRPDETRRSGGGAWRGARFYCFIVVPSRNGGVSGMGCGLWVVDYVWAMGYELWVTWVGKGQDGDTCSVYAGYVVAGSGGGLALGGRQDARRD